LKTNLPARLTLAVALAAAALLAVAAPMVDAKKPRTAKVRVMTRNLFIGTDLKPLATTPPGPQFEQAAGKALEQATVTNQPKERMKLIAGEIAKAKPDLVGFQEVTIWRTGPKNDPAPATHVRVDYLKEIMRELKRRKAGYRVVTVYRPLNAEGPTDRGVDARFTIGTAVIARKGVKVSHVKSAKFRHQLTLPTFALGKVTTYRTFDQMDARVRGAKIHFVNTHLEAYLPKTRLQQAKELLRRALKSHKKKQVLVGDLNSGPDLDNPDDRKPFAAIVKAGFRKARTKTEQCCFNDDLRTGTWDHIVDWVLTRPKVKLVKSFVTGRERTSGGAAASDHGGVVSVLRVRR
jgi:endonuclease/exonuclease/phosphatase family metal-dependent hydrolase